MSMAKSQLDLRLAFLGRLVRHFGDVGRVVLHWSLLARLRSGIRTGRDLLVPVFLLLLDLLVVADVAWVGHCVTRNGDGAFSIGRRPAWVRQGALHARTESL